MTLSRSRLTVVARSVAFAVALFGGWFACTQQGSEPVAPEVGSPAASLGVSEVALSSTMVVQERQTDNLMAIPGVVGTGVGVTRDGRAAIKVFTKNAGVTGIPVSLQNVPVLVQVTGEFHSMELRRGMTDLAPLSNTTKRFERPVPIGVSTGNAGECSAGTISARVKNAAGDVFALSNNHVYALQNTAPIGSQVRQPGLFDTVPQCANRPADAIGTLSAFKPMVFTTSANNKIDAAIAETSTANLKKKTPGDGYGTPLSATEAGTVGRAVQKFGRTTKLTHGEITAINATINVGYPAGVARFVKQLIVEDPAGGFIQPGDSGSLLVGDPDRHPIGLLFAGNGPGTLAVANKIDLVLTEFGVTIDGQ